MTITATTIKTLLDMGASRWTKGDHDRLYLKDIVGGLIGLSVNYHSSGNISSAALNGEKISNAEAGRIYNALGNAYINLKTGSVAVVNHDHYASKALKAAIASIIEKENAQDASPELSAGSPDESTSTTTVQNSATESKAVDGAKELQGSEKQIALAKEIRATMLAGAEQVLAEAIDEEIQEGINPDDAPGVMNMRRYIGDIKDITSAQWFISNRDVGQFYGSYDAGAFYMTFEHIRVSNKSIFQ